MYADDTSVLISGNDLIQLVCSLNVELELLSTWLKANKLSHNAQKTLSCFSQGKYLGVIIDHKLNWCEHISYVKNKVSKGIDC